MDQTLSKPETAEQLDAEAGCPAPPCSASPIQDMWRENFNSTLSRGFRRVRERAVEVLETFEAETPVTIRMIMDEDRLFAVVRTDDDGRDPVVIWNEADVDGYNYVREVWLPTAVAETVGAFVNEKTLEKLLARNQAGCNVES